MADKLIVPGVIEKYPGVKSALRGQVDIFQDNSGVALYNFGNETANDSGNSHNGTWNGTETYSNGVIGKAAYFNGGSRINLMDLTSLWNNGGFSISFWFNSSDIVNYRNILSTDNADGENCIRIEQNNNKEMAVIGDSGDGLISNAFYNLTENTWYHLVILAGKSNGLLKSYLNCVLGTEQEKTLTSNLDVFNLTIGVGYSNSRYFKGSIDQIRVFNKLLSVDEVQYLYDNKC
jgi:hypothetical protein